MVTIIYYYDGLLLTKVEKKHVFIIIITNYNNMPTQNKGRILFVKGLI